MAELRRWWGGLDEDRAARAELRRCRTVLDVMQVPAFHAVRQRLLKADLSQRDSEHPRLAVVVGLLSHLKQNGELEPAKAFSEGDQPPVSPLRFRQVLEARDDDELFVRLRRVLPLVGLRVNLDSLVYDTFHWGDTTRKNWVYAYRWPQKQSA